MTIAVDFDGTIVEHEYPMIGKPIPFAFETLLKLQQEGHRLILWTVREGRLLRDAIRFCEDRGLIFYAHNANFREENRLAVPRKLMVDLFIDDRNLGGLPDWGIIYNAIDAMVQGKDSFRAIMEHLPKEPEKPRKGLFRFFKINK